MFRLEKEFRWEAAHHLPNHDGRCRRIHGHSFKGRIVVEGPRLHQDGPKRGMLVDYGQLSDVLKPLIEQYLDHHDLNETLAPFGVTDPTSEAIARWLFWELEPKIRDISLASDRDIPAYIQQFAIQLMEVHVEETCTCKCVYTRPQPGEPR